MQFKNIDFSHLKSHQMIISGLLFILIFLFFSTFTVSALPYDSYTYDYWGDAVPSPNPYTPRGVIDGEKLGVGNFDNPQDLFVNDENIYIADTGNQRLIILEHDLKVEQIIDSYEQNGEEKEFSAPYGIFVTENEQIYIADRDANEIVVLEKDGTFNRIIPDPSEDPEVKGIIPEGFNYKPVNLGVNPAGRLYVISENNYHGLLEFSQDDKFSGFTGTPEVSPDPTDLLIKQYGTEEQRSRIALTLPTLYSGLDVDSSGFLYVTIAVGELREQEGVRRLNPSGEDTLIRQGFYPQVGDINYPEEDDDVSNPGPSSLIDIAVYDQEDSTNSVYTALDRKRGRLFTYDGRGNLLYVFGDTGGKIGTFRNPVAVEYLNDKIIVLDKEQEFATIFQPTEYTKTIMSALNSYEAGHYDRAEEQWKEVLQFNYNFEQAYSGIGRANLNNEKHEQAMTNYKLGNNRDGYSEAFEYYRREVIAQHFSTIIYTILVLILLFILFFKINLVSKIKKRLNFEQSSANKVLTNLRDKKWYQKIVQTGSNLKYALHIIFHPFDGFWVLKKERKSGLLAANIILFLVIAAFVFARQYTGFLFNPYDISQLNIILEALTIIIPVILWSVSNWSLTTLVAGKGTLKEIYISTVYSLTPIIVIFIPMTIISNYLTLNEGSFYYFVLSFAVTWSFILIFTGNMVIHEFLVGKIILITILSIIGMAVILFVALLFINVVQQMMGFVNSIYMELVLRL